MLRFHLDEHVAPAIAAGLRQRGIDVTTTVDADLLGATDDQHLAFAAAEGRVIVTHDDDFVRHAMSSVHGGIAYCAPQARTIGQLVRYLHLMSECLEPEDIRNRVEFL